MKKIVAAGFLLVAGVELMSLAGADRRLVLIMSGVAARVCAAHGALVPDARVRTSTPKNSALTMPQSRCAAGCLVPRR